MTDIKSLTFPELQAFVADSGFPKFRAAQISGWLQKGVTDFDEMRNLPEAIRSQLKTSCYISVANIEKKFVSRYDKTVKYLFSFRDGECVESVLAQRDRNIRISNVVLMGMGEPLDNYDNVLRFLRLVSDENGLNIGMRHITLSTCGIVPKIEQLARERLQINLAVSLHAPNDDIRSRTMPIAKAYPMERLLEACRYYFDMTGRRVTFEYALINGVNDTDACAKELGRKLRGMNCHVNLIPVNTVEGTGYIKSDLQRQKSFENILAADGVTATVRRTLGSDINASCGQLRRKHLIEGGQ